MWCKLCSSDAVFYIATLSVGYICMLMAGTWMSRLLKNNLMDDVFNTENESFQQETRLIEKEDIDKLLSFMING